MGSLVILVAAAAIASTEPESLSDGRLETIAETAVKAKLSIPESIKFRAAEVAVVDGRIEQRSTHKRFEGPVKLVCGQYALKNATGGHGSYSWYFVAMKDGVVLFSEVDTSQVPYTAYEDCRQLGR